MSQSEPLVNATDYPLYVVTAAADGQRSGCMAGFVTQSSLQPIRFLICISRVNHTFAVADKSEGLALHLLGADQYGQKRRRDYDPHLTLRRRGSTIF